MNIWILKNNIMKFFSGTIDRKEYSVNINCMSVVIGDRKYYKNFSGV